MMFDDLLNSIFAFDFEIKLSCRLLGARAFQFQKS